jgi:hypothetical protein
MIPLSGGSGIDNDHMYTLPQRYCKQFGVKHGFKVPGSVMKRPHNVLTIRSEKAVEEYISKHKHPRLPQNVVQRERIARKRQKARKKAKASCKNVKGRVIKSRDRCPDGYRWYGNRTTGNQHKCRPILHIKEWQKTAGIKTYGTKPRKCPPGMRNKGDIRYGIKCKCRRPEVFEALRREKINAHHKK